MEPFIKIFGLEIPIYGVCWMAGIFISAFIALFLSKRQRIEKFDVVCSAVYASIGGMIGSKLLFIAVTLKKIIEENIPFAAVLKGGFVFYGGLIGGIIGLLIYTKQYKLKFMEFTDLYACVLPFGHALGRIGCHASGCCYGIEYDGPFNVVYTESLGLTPLGTPLFPIQLLEAVILLILFIVLLIVFLKTEKRGLVTGIYLYAYSVLRFILEFFRGDLERGKFMRLSTSQIVSILIIVCLSIIIIVSAKRRKKPKS